MQNVNMKKRNCHRFSTQAEQLMNCTPQLQRIRCCGHVLTDQELLVNGQGRGQGMGNNQGRGQGRGQCIAKGQSQGRGRGQGMVNDQDQQG